MRPSEIELLLKFREALVKAYTTVGASGKDKVFRSNQIKEEFKNIIDFYDALFKDAIAGK